MFKDKKRNLVLSIVFFQIYLGIISGVIIVIITSKFNVPENVWVDSIHLVDMKSRDIVKNVEEYFNPKLKEKKIILNSDGEKFEIKFSDIDVKIHTKYLESEVIGDGNPKFIKNNIEGYFFFKKRDIEPKVVYDELKLRYKLIEFAKKVDIEPTNAKINIQNGKIKITEEKTGYKFNVDKVLANLKSKIGVNLKDEVLGEKKEVKPDVGKEELEGLEIVGIEKIQISNVKNKKDIDNVSEILNNLIILPVDIWELQKNKKFSFSKYLFGKDVKIQNSNDYSIIIEHLYELISKCDIDEENIRIVTGQKSSGMDKNEPTKKMRIKDIEFYNSSKKPIIISIEKSKDEITLTCIGKKKE